MPFAIVNSRSVNHEHDIACLESATRTMTCVVVARSWFLCLGGTGNFQIKWWIFAGWEWCHWKENRRYEAKCIFDDHIVHVVYILTSYWGCPSNSDRALSQVATFQNWNKFMSEEFWIQQSPNSFGLCARKNSPKRLGAWFCIVQRSWG